MRRHWFVAVLPVFLFVAGAVALGLKRPVRYTTKATLSVGHVYVSNPAGIPTVIEATRSLAATYSRAIRSSVVLDDVRRRLQNRPTPVTGHLSATPIPQSPLISVSAESSSASAAVALANAGSDALIAYVNRQVRDNDAAGLLSDRYRAAALRYRNALERRDQAQRRYAEDRTAAHKAAYQRAASDADTALLRREAISGAYATAVQGGSSSVAVESFARAETPTSDRNKILQLLLFVGLVGGLACGAALALLLEYRRMRRLPA